MSALAAALSRRAFSRVDGASGQLCLAAGLIALLLAGAFVLPLPPWLGTPTPRPPVGQPPAPGLGLAGALVALAFALALWLPFRPYTLALRAARAGFHGSGLLPGLTALVALAALAIYPRFGTDLWEYVAYERLWRVYGENPLLATPSLHPEDWSFAFAWYPNRPNAYGPLWQLMAWPLNAAGGDSAAGQLIAHKLLAALGYTACAALLWRGVPRHARAQALIAFAWNPLVLFEVLGKVHNDILPAALLVAAVLLAGRGAPANGLVAATLAALVKARAAGGGLGLLKKLWLEQAWGSLAVGLAASGTLVVALYAPFWAGPRLLEPLRSQMTQVVWSPGALLMLLCQALSGDRHETAIRLALIVTWLLAAGLLLWRLPARSTEELAALAALLLLATLVLLTTAFYAHYLVPVVALAALSGRPGLQAAVTLLALGSLGAYAGAMLGLAFGSGWADSDAYRLLGSLLSFAPALVLVLWQRGAPWLDRTRRARWR